MDEAKGFDNYLLTTPVNEIYAWKLLKLKRQLLIELGDKENFAGRRILHFFGFYCLLSRIVSILFLKRIF